MNENQARKIVRFYLEITDVDDLDIKKYLIKRKVAVRYFNLKSNEIVKTVWNIGKLTEKSRLYNNVVTNNTFKEHESGIESVDILIPLKK